MARRRFQDPKPRKEGRWWYLRIWEDILQDGVRTRRLKRIKLALATMRERQVRKIAQEIIAPKNRGIITAGSAVNFSEYVDSTYMKTEFIKRASSVQSCYKGMIEKYLKPHFGKLAIGEIMPYTVDAYFSGMPSRGIPFPTMSKIRDALSSVMRSAAKYNYVGSNPLDGLELPPDKRGKRAKPFIYPAQFQALLEVVPEPYATLLYVAAWTGLRVSELFALKWGNVHADCITIERRYCRGDWSHPKTERSAATIPVDPSVIERIQRLRQLTVDVRAGSATRHFRLVKSDGPDDLVFQSVKDGKPMNDGNILRRFIKPAAAKIGAPWVNWRCLRTSCATWMVQAGADPKSVQGQMRHSRISTTMEIYAQFVPEGQRRAVNQMSEYVRAQVAQAGTKPGTLLVQ